jgi:hypothetical protein
MRRASSLAKLGYNLYIGIGSVVILIASLAYESWGLAALAAAVLAYAIWRLYVLRTDPDE